MVKPKKKEEVQDHGAAEQKKDDVLERMKSKMEGIAVSTTQNLPLVPYIYKVHKQLRQVNQKAYEPETLAIGPYHHGKDNLKMMEQHKWRFLKALVTRKPDLTIESYILAVEEMEQHARSCYAESISQFDHPDEFIEMLVLDGCFIVELVRRWNNREFTDPIFQTKWTTGSLRRDLMLYENQIPFFILCKLFDLIEAPNQHDRLMKLLLEFFHDVFYVDVTNSTSSQDTNLFGLMNRWINLLRLSIYPTGAVEINGLSTTSRNLLHINPNPQGVKHILDLLHSNWSYPANSSEQRHNGVREEFRFIQRAKELRNANVEFRVLKEANTSLFAVDFNKAAGILSMAPLKINDRTECAFRNLIAYEQYFPHRRPTFFTDYMMLLDCLINTAKDVEILSQSKIIENWSGNNKEVAKIINQLGQSVDCAHPDHYANTFRLINRHCNKKWNRAMANLKRNYFNSPWAYVSFLAAIVLLLLTIAQTVLAAIQLP